MPEEPKTRPQSNRKGGGDCTDSRERATWEIEADSIPPETLKAHPWMRTFLDGMAADNGSVAAGARKAGVVRRTPYSAREDHPEFAAAWDAIVEERTDWIESTSEMLAAEGVTERRYDKEGNLTSERQHYYPALNLRMLASRRKKIYGDDGSGSMDPKSVGEMMRQYSRESRALDGRDAPAEGS